MTEPVILEPAAPPVVADAKTEEDRQLAGTLRALFPAPAGLNADGLRHWHEALDELLSRRVPELRQAGITSSSAIAVARIVANHGYRSGVPATLTGLASGHGMLSAARVAQFFAAPVSVIAAVAAVAGSLGAGAAQTAWDRAVERIYLDRLSTDPQHPTLRLLGELERRDDQAGLVASAASAFRQDSRQFVNLDGLDFRSGVVALANHLLPVLGPPGDPAIESLACNREAQRFIATAPVEAFTSTLQSKVYKPQRYAADGTPLDISRADVGMTLRERRFLSTLARSSTLGRVLAAPAALALNYATNATKSVRAFVVDIMQHVFDPHTNAISGAALPAAASAASPPPTSR